jgi:hypothetical protein
MTDRDVMKIAGAAKVQLFFCGGQGGVGAYDGKGGPMEKDGGPMDRLFLLRSEGPVFELGGDHGLDITYGSLRVRTGPLSKDVEIAKRDKADTVVRFRFEGNAAADAIELTGGMPDLDYLLGRRYLAAM